MENRISHAHFLIESAKYDEAAQIIHQIIDDSDATINEKADAFQFLGLLAQIYPASINDDDAFSYYKQALELLPDHLGSLMGVVTTYGNHFPDHQDYNAFESAMKKLLKRIDEIDENAVDEIVKRKALLVHTTSPY
jgi:tetratricopeptide (TPR) repeat protein